MTVIGLHAWLHPPLQFAGKQLLTASCVSHGHTHTHTHVHNDWASEVLRFLKLVDPRTARGLQLPWRGAAVGGGASLRNTHLINCGESVPMIECKARNRTPGTAVRQVGCMTLRVDARG